MRSKVCIPMEEYGQRIARAAKLVSDRGYDLLIANSNEADFANVRVAWQRAVAQAHVAQAREGEQEPGPDPKAVWKKAFKI